MLANRDETSENFSKKICNLLFPIVFCISNIFLFAPFTIYQGNIGEFAIPLTSILLYFFIPALILTLLLFIAGLFFSKNLYERYVVILLVFGTLVWLQGNIFVWKYGLLDGQGFDWSKNIWRGWIDGGIWIFLLTASVLLYRVLYRIALITGMTLFLLQIAFLIFTSVQKPELWSHKENLSLFLSPPQEIFEFSSKQNVIHIILDGFQSDVFQEIVDENSEHYYLELEGFTFFKENTGSFPTTYMSIPAILSGKIYQNNIPMRSFVKKIFKENAIPNVLYDNGYEVDLVLTVGYSGYGKHCNKYHLPIPYGVTKSEYILENSALMFDLVLFRLSPHFIKRYVYNNQLWFVQRILNKNNNMNTFAYFAHKAFLEDMIDNLSINRKKPVYKFIHVATPHTPFVVNEDCVFSGKPRPGSRDNLKIQAKCSLDQILTFFDVLKSNGVYDSSLIIINADHGAGKKVKMKNVESQLDEGGSTKIEEILAIAGSAIPLMAIKPPFSKGPLRISNAQTTLADIPTTITSILKLNNTFDGRPMFEINPEEIRERKFFYYRWLHDNWQADYFDYLEEYIINGSVFDRNSWKKGSTYHSPNSLYVTDKIDFGTSEANRFLRIGWGDNEKSKNGELSFNWALGNVASLFLTLPKNKTTLLTANINSFPFENRQYVTVKVDDNKLGVWELSSHCALEKYNILIDPDKNRPDVSLVEFNFTEQKKPDNRDPRPLAVLFESISLSELKPYEYGAKIQFGINGNSQTYQTDGWSFPEKGFTWSIGQSASLNIPINMPKTPFIILKGNVSAFLFAGKVDKQTVQILINNKKVEEWIITDNGFHEKTLILPKSLFANSNRVEITFNTPNAASPAQVGYNNDIRVLGIAFQSVDLNEKI